MSQAFRPAQRLAIWQVRGSSPFSSTRRNTYTWILKTAAGHSFWPQLAGRLRTAPRGHRASPAGRARRARPPMRRPPSPAARSAPRPQACPRPALIVAGAHRAPQPGGEARRPQCAVYGPTSVINSTGIRSSTAGEQHDESSSSAGSAMELSSYWCSEREARTEAAGHD
jgi:hypothetical protein